MPDNYGEDTYRRMFPGFIPPEVPDKGVPPFPPMEESALVKAQARMIADFQVRVADYEEQLKAEAWMCRHCKSSFPKSLVKLTTLGVTQCIRCHKAVPGNIVRAGEAIRLMMQEQILELEATIAGQTQTIQQLTEEIGRMKEEAKKRRLRPGEPRTVEEA